MFVSNSIPQVRLAAIYFAYFAYVGGYSPYITLYFQSIGQSAQAIGILLAISQTIRVFAPPFWAWLADQSGARLPLLRIALILSTLFFTGLFYTTSFVGLALVLTLQSFCAGGVNPLAETITFAALRDAVAKYGSIRLWGSVGFIAAVLGVGYQLDHAPPSAMLWSVLVMLIAAVLVSWTLPAMVVPTHAKGESVRGVLRRPAVMALFTACFLMSMAHGPLYAFYTIHLADNGYGKSSIGWLWSLGVVAEIVVFWMMPRWLHAGTLGPVLIATFVCAVVRFVLVGWFPEVVAAQLISQLLHGATFGAYHVCSIALVNRWFGEAGRARGQALYASLSFGAGGMIGSAASGWLWVAVGPALMFSITSVVASIGLIPLIRHRKMLH
ncbi:MAG: MFS transporter [Betaproteobacteria bacterium]|nr:MFS transporter [Betaproteobacteria bacterium]